MTYVKARFTSQEHGSTAGLVIDAAKFRQMTITDFSRLFPYSEALKMKRIEVSPEYNTWDEAFAHQFE